LFRDKKISKYDKNIYKQNFKINIVEYGDRSSFKPVVSNWIDRNFERVVEGEPELPSSSRAIGEENGIL